MYGNIELNYEEEWDQYIGDPVYPAIIKNIYGDGQVYSMMFNPLFSNPDGVDERRVVETVVGNLTPVYSSYLSANSLFAVSTEISSQESESYQMKHVVELPAGFRTLEGKGYSSEGNMLVQEFTIQSGETVHLDALAVTAENTGEYNLQSLLYYYDEQRGWQLAEDILLDCQIE